MTCFSILAGLSETKDFWSTFDLLRYLCLIVVLDAAAGLYTANVVEQCETFALPRCGYARWYHRAMLGSGASVCLVLGAITGISCLLSEGQLLSLLLAAAILGLNLLVMTGIQLFLSLLTKNISLGYLICMLIQLLSLFVSERYPMWVKLLLIGNWGMMVRSTLVDSNGLPIGQTITLECILLILLWAFGWRILRRNRRGV
jgi:hypothetical protein